MLVISDKAQFLDLIQEVYNKGCEDMYMKMAGIKAAEARAPITVDQIIERFIKPRQGKTHRNTLLARIKERGIPTLKGHPVTIEYRYVSEVLAA